MPFEISFTKALSISNPGSYFNPCCVGGDVVLERLLPVIRVGYSDIRTGQEDWGWFAWFREGKLRLAVDIFCDEAERGEFRIFITGREKRFLFETLVDTPPVAELRDRVVASLQGWVDTGVTSVRLDKDHNPGDAGA